MTPNTPNLDERLAALTMSLELLAADMRAVQERQNQQEARERKARLALLAGIQAYLLALNAPDNGEEK